MRGEDDEIFNPKQILIAICHTKISYTIKGGIIMSEQKKLSVEGEIKNSKLNENMQKHTLEFIAFLTNNEFSIEPEEDGNGWQIIYMSECVGHMNFIYEVIGHDSAIWIDTCDFGNSDSADDILKETTWSHVRVCEHLSSGGKKCGCSKQPGFNGTIFGKEHKNLCFAHFEFLNPDAKTLENIKELMHLFRQNKINMQIA